MTSIAVNGTTVLSSVTYEPFGPVNGWTWGNGTTFTRAFNGDGLISGITSPANQETLAYDDASRISGITNTSAGSSNWTYGYDLLDHLNAAAHGTTKYGWTYDANGNRLTQTGTSAATYTISTSSNQIASITGALARTYTYDAAGNTKGYGTITETYSDSGRLVTVQKGTSTEKLEYNALGERIKTSGGAAGTILYAYDQAGHLLGEYSGTGALIEETVWLGDIPVATLRPGTPAAIYYVQTDQLDTPRQVTRQSDNVQMWRWFSDPFGTTAPNQNPQSAGNFTYNLRFPGQIHDPQIGLDYNYFRDYDSAVGRYVESDPMGLDGGSYSTYAYAGGNPISNYDPDGQQVAAGAEVGTLVDPGLGTVIGGVIGAGVEAGAAVYEVCRDHNCPPCTPYGAGTIGYEGPHTTHEHFSKVLGRYLNPHLHLWIVRQNTTTCGCFWRRATPDSAEPPPDPGWVDLNGGFPPLFPPSK